MYTQLWLPTLAICSLKRALEVLQVSCAPLVSEGSLRNPLANHADVFNVCTWCCDDGAQKAYNFLICSCDGRAHSSAVQASW